MYFDKFLISEFSLLCDLDNSKLCILRHHARLKWKLQNFNFTIEVVQISSTVKCIVITKSI